MTSTSLKWAFLAVAALILSANFSVFCAPSPDTANVRSDAASSVNSTFYNSFGFDEDEDDSTEELDEVDTDRIAGGQYAAPDQFPFMAVVHRLMGGGMVSQCGGTVISSRWVLTAGHCVQPLPRRFLVVFGIYDKTGIGYSQYQGSGIAMITRKGVLHPAYRTTVNDVALLYMPRNIPIGDGIQAIQLADGSGSYASSMGTVIGWGKDGPMGSGTTRLKYATLPIISTSECSEYWDVTRKHICTAPGYGQDACQGDSGGPLIVTEDGEPVQVGIVSYGDGGCPSNRPGVFTRVSKFVDWIEDVTNARL